MKLLFLNGSRGEWGYIRPIIDLCKINKLDYGICATNMLLLPNYGKLIEEIKNDGYKVVDEIFMSLEGHNHFTMTKSLGLFLCSFVETILREKPNWVILAGDRGEQLMGAIAASYTYTPVAHIQAGEKSGNIDGIARHAIGKFVHLHFAANIDAKNRLIALGEESFRILNVGAPQLDELRKLNIPQKKEIVKKLNIPKNKFILVVQHPVTEQMENVSCQVNTLSDSLKEIDICKIWILPNNDAGSNSLKNSLFLARDSNTFIHDNLSRIDYLSLLKYAEFIIGNSSSGILEAPTFKTPAINIGRRQIDRLQGVNVVNCEYNNFEIKNCINEVLSKEFKHSLRNCRNPYGDGNSAQKILKILKQTNINDKLLIKRLTY